MHRDEYSINDKKDVDLNYMLIQKIEAIILSSLYESYKMGIPRLASNDFERLVFTNLGNDMTLNVKKINLMIDDVVSSLIEQNYIIASKNGRDYLITSLGIEEYEKRQYQNLP